MTRRTRQQAELRQLCADGQLARAVDLAFEHFADFGPDVELVAAMADAVEQSSTFPAVRARFAELTDSVDRHVEARPR